MAEQRRGFGPVVGGYGIGALFIVLAVILAVLVLLGAIKDPDDKIEWFAIAALGIGVLL